MNRGKSDRLVVADRDVDADPQPKSRFRLSSFLRPWKSARNAVVLLRQILDLPRVYVVD